MSSADIPDIDSFAETVAERIYHRLNALAYTVPEAAHALRISHSKMKDLIARGEIPRAKIGARTVISRAALERYLHDLEIGRVEPPWPAVAAGIEAQVFGTKRAGGRTAKARATNGATSGMQPSPLRRVGGS